MGYASAMDMLRWASSERQALHWHLTSNHFPPIPECIVPVAQRVLRLIRAGKHDAKVTLPEGITHRRYGRRVPVEECARAWHLDAFLTEEGGEE